MRNLVSFNQPSNDDERDPGDMYKREHDYKAKTSIPYPQEKNNPAKHIVALLQDIVAGKSREETTCSGDYYKRRGRELIATICYTNPTRCHIMLRDEHKLININPPLASSNCYELLRNQCLIIDKIAITK